MAYGIYGSQKGCEKFTLSSKWSLCHCAQPDEKRAWAVSTSAWDCGITVGVWTDWKSLAPVLYFTPAVDTWGYWFRSQDFLVWPIWRTCKLQLAPTIKFYSPVQGAIYPAVQTGASGLWRKDAPALRLACEQLISPILAQTNSWPPVKSDRLKSTRVRD